MLKTIAPSESLRPSISFRPHRSLALASLSAFILVAPLLHGQVATGDILGKVTDNTGAVIPGATVRVENIGTHQIRTFQSGGNGEYVFSLLQPGTYEVMVTSPSYKTFDAANVVVSASDRIRIDAALQVGAVEERVTVTSTPTALQTDSTTVGSTITEKTLLDAPLNGRNFIGLVQVQAGVNAGSPNSLSSGSNIVDRRQSSSVSANGQEELFNNNQLDGLDNNSRAIGTLLIRPSVEAIGEVRTDINLYTAETGRTGGASINVITKAGANQFHGSAYEFFRNDITDARNFFATASLLISQARATPESVRRQSSQVQSSAIAPSFLSTTKASGSINGNNSVYILYRSDRRRNKRHGQVISGTSVNPLLSKLECSSGLATREVYPTAASLDPTALAYFKLFPQPNQFGPANQWRNGQ